MTSESPSVAVTVEPSSKPSNMFLDLPSSDPALPNDEPSIQPSSVSTIVQVPMTIPLQSSAPSRAASSIPSIATGISSDLPSILPPKSPSSDPSTAQSIPPSSLVDFPVVEVGASSSAPSLSPSMKVITNAPSKTLEQTSHPSASPVALRTAQIFLSLTGLPCGEMDRSKKVEFGKTLQKFLGLKLGYEIHSATVLGTDDNCGSFNNTSRVLRENNVMDVTSMVGVMAPVRLPEIVRMIEELFDGDGRIEFVELLRSRDFDGTYFSLLNDAVVRYMPSTMPSSMPSSFLSITPSALPSSVVIPSVPDNVPRISDTSSATIEHCTSVQKAIVYVFVSLALIM